MHENEQMASELAFQNRETERLLQKNRKLADENMSTRRELAMYKQVLSLIVAHFDSAPVRFLPISKTICPTPPRFINWSMPIFRQIRRLPRRC